MSKFIHGNELNNELTKLIKNAFESIVFISPYIKIHDRLKDELRNIKNKEGINFILIFGKNKEKISKSLSLNEIEFLKQFPNLEIKYENRLHAKYYANEETSILTSMNLYDFSMNNNIEFGILSKNKFLGSDSLDTDASEFFQTVADGAKTIYRQVAKFETSLGGFKRKFTGIEVELDETNKFYLTDRKTSVRKPNDSKRIGFCIRTGEAIEFNVKMPFSEKSYKSWNKFKDENYKEKFCHFSGEKSNGDTTFKKPILAKNWKIAIKK